MTLQRLLHILLVMAGLLLFVFLAVFLRQRPLRQQTPFAQTIDSAEKITLQTGPARMTLDREGTVWMVIASTPSGRYKANSDKVKILQKGLRDLLVEDMISSRAENAEEFEVNPGSAAHITLFGKNGAPLAEGIFGKQAPDFAHLYFKFPGKPEVYLARGAIRRELGVSDLKTWRDHTLLNVTEDQVLTLLIEGPGYKTALARSSDTWSCNGKIVSPTHVWGTLGILAHLMADDFVDPTQDPQVTPNTFKFATVTLQIRDGSTHELRVGSMDPKTKRYPVSVNQELNAAWVAEGTIKAILQKPSDFPPS